MAKNQRGKNSKGVCERIYNATFRKMRRVPKHPLGRPLSIHSNEVIPIESDPMVQKTAKPVIVSSKKPPHVEEEDVNSKTSDYIKRVMNKMMSKPAVVAVGADGGKIVSRHDTFNDKVANYITRAKNKIRTTSGVGGNSASFK